MEGNSQCLEQKERSKAIACHSLNPSAEHVANLPLDRIFSHQLELRVRLFFPHRDFCKSYSDGTIAERILSRLVDVVQIAPGYIHGALIVERRYRPVAQLPFGSSLALRAGVTTG